MKGLAQQMREQRISLTVAFVALVFAVGGGAFAGAAATRLITGRQIKNGSITSADLRNGTVRSTDIARGQVRAGDIGRGQVRAASIGRDQVTAEAVAADAVGGEQIAPNSVGSGEVAPNAIGSASIANGGVQSSDIGTGQVGSNEIANGQVTPQDVTMPEPAQFSRPAGQPASVEVTSPAYTLVAVMGTYVKQDSTSALEVSWTGTAEANDPSGPNACVFQLRVDGLATDAGEVFVAHGGPIGVSATALFGGLPAGPHQVEVWARVVDYSRPFTCTVGPLGSGVAQTTVVREQIV